MKALYSWERDSLEEPHDAVAMERSALKGENIVWRKRICEPKERVQSKVPPRNLRARLNVGEECQSV